MSPDAALLAPAQVLFEGHPIRTLPREDGLWFIGRDVATALGYTNSRDALRKHVEEDEKGVAYCDTPGGKQRLSIISELGVYGLILGSELPEARPFKRWVKALIQRYRQGDITLADEVLQRNDSERDAEWLAMRGAVKAGRLGLTDVLQQWHSSDNHLIENVTRLVSRACIGMTSAEFRKLQGLKRSQAVRDSLTYEQLSDVRWLERRLAQVLSRCRDLDHHTAYGLCREHVQSIYSKQLN